ncbi:hypothetical protein Fcan01_21154 [Folsomia candida]|uniref:Uncharacterized protein n=1 Tax=Folsomia candida TaxID=158441 RepID=A0A226DFL7_FOLCA|nr:hypothetical protein Fcan01_21154 [Folsomia candida]
MAGSKPRLLANGIGEGIGNIVYCVAFAVELWWIVESMLILPAPAYTLCSLYFFNFIMAAVLLFGLLVRQRKYLMSWTLMTVLSFFPEAGMVLFMSLYYWPGHKYEYGVIELVYWSIRAMFNIFGAVCVCSLYLTWRDEELILGRLHDLTLANVEVESQSVGSIFLSGGGGGGGNLSVLGRQQPYLGGGAGGGTLIRGGGHLIGDNLTLAALKGNGFGGTLKSKSMRTTTTFRDQVDVQLDVSLDVDVGVENYINCGGSGGNNVSASEKMRDDGVVVSDIHVDLGLNKCLEIDVVGLYTCRSKNGVLQLEHHDQRSPSLVGGGREPTDVSTRGRFWTIVAQWCRRIRLLCGVGGSQQLDQKNSLSLVSDFGGYGCGRSGETDLIVIRNGFISTSRTHLNTISPQTNNSNTALRASLLRMKSEFNPASLFDPASRKQRISELGIAGIGLEPPGQIPLHSNGPRSRSLWNVSNEDYWSRPPPSRPVSMGYVNYAHQLDQLNNYNNYHHHHHASDLDPLQYHIHYSPNKSSNLANMRSQSHTHLASVGTGGTLRANLNPLGQVNKNNKNYGGSNLFLTRSGGGGSGWEELRSFQQGRRAQSMNALNVNLISSLDMNTASPNTNATLFQQRYYGQNIMTGGNGGFMHSHHHPHHSTLQRREWSKSSVDDDDDDERDDGDVRSYQDIPL